LGRQIEAATPAAPAWFSTGLSPAFGDNADQHLVSEVVK
jgi:hypothetical protein